MFIFAGISFVSSLSIKLGYLPFGGELVFQIGLIFLVIGLVMMGAPLTIIRPSILLKVYDWYEKKTNRKD